MEMLFSNTLYFYQNSLQETKCGSPVVPAAGVFLLTALWYQGEGKSPKTRDCSPSVATGWRALEATLGPSFRFLIYR